ncbi:hypothetical protein J6590_071340 [Homalodisca vitripennis]|nr:hypothetical protein J6590_071340 [Homalodisca vitripennis]
MLFHRDLNVSHNVDIKGAVPTVVVVADLVNTVSQLPSGSGRFCRRSPPPLAITTPPARVKSRYTATTNRNNERRGRNCTGTTVMKCLRSTPALLRAVSAEPRAFRPD